jgi:hypothetical protein
MDPGKGELRMYGFYSAEGKIGAAFITGYEVDYIREVSTIQVKPHTRSDGTLHATKIGKAGYGGHRIE